MAASPLKKPSTPTGRSPLASAGLQMLSPAAAVTTTSTASPAASKVDAANAGTQKSAADEPKRPAEDGKMTPGGEEAAARQAASPEPEVTGAKKEEQSKVVGEGGVNDSKPPTTANPTNDDKESEPPAVNKSTTPELFSSPVKEAPKGEASDKAPSPAPPPASGGDNGAKDAAPSPPPKGGEGGGGGAEAQQEPLPDKLVGQIHSTVRWDKPASDLEALVKEAGVNMCIAIQAPDPKNGNQCLHIAAQNGHIGLVKFLVGAKANVNAQNKKGQTALHMSVQYDCYFQSKFLIDNGADTKLTNGDGFEALLGIEGNKVEGEAWDHPLTMLKSAGNREELDQAFAALEAADPATIDKAALAQTGMAKKRALKDIWDVKRFQEYMKKL